MTRPTQIKLDGSALRHNLSVVKTTAPQQSIVAMVKANGYGHGLTWVANVLDGSVNYFGVACLEEAITLREAGIQTPALLMEGLFSADELKVAHESGCSIVIHQLEQLDLLRQYKLKKPQEIWIKVNTGMNRLGFHPDQFPYVYEVLDQIPQIKKPVIAMTHFSDADETLSPLTRTQIQLFEKTIAGYPVKKSLANSAGILNWPESFGDIIRPGIMLYGISPFDQVFGIHHGLRPVMSLHSELMAVRTCQRGDRIGYGGQFVCPETMPVGVIAIGYGDGYPRHAPNGAYVLVNERPVPLIGRVSMDMITVDLRTQPLSKKGDPVLLWGHGLPVEELAARSGTIAYELLCHMTARVPKQGSVVDSARPGA